MARTKAFDESKALEAAMLQFWKNGYEATSIQALEDAMGLKRTSIYNAFGNKRALFRLALAYYQENVLSQFQQILDQAETVHDALYNSLNAVIQFNSSKTNPGGCLVVLSLLEGHQHDKATKATLDKTLQQLTKALLERIKQGIREGELAKNTADTQIAEQVTALITGMNVMAKANYSKNTLKNLAQFSVKTLLP